MIILVSAALVGLVVFGVRYYVQTFPLSSQTTVASAREQDRCPELRSREPIVRAETA